MEIIFPFREEESKTFGCVFRPIAEVTFIHNNIELPEMVYIDSGADYTLIPKSVGSILGFIIEMGDNITEVKGIKENIPIIFKTIKIKIGEKIIETKVAWALIEEVPLLLGREGIFNHFTICFKKNKETLFTLNT